MIRKTIKLLLCALALMTSAGVQADVQRQAVYEGDVLLWRCMQLNETGTYNDYDGLVYHTLHFRTIDTTRVIEPDVVLCEGDTLLWRCRQLWQAGVYVDTILSKEFSDLDSVYYQIKVTKQIADTVQQAIQISLGETLLWRCYQIPAVAEGTFHYYDTVPGSPCATYYHLTLTVGCPALIEPATEEITICKGDTLLWYCDPIFEAKAGGELYEYTEKSKLFPACDSIIHRLKLTVTEADTVQQAIQISLGETLLWRCYQIPAVAEGVFHYYDTVPGTPCAEYYHLTLTVGCPALIEPATEEITICKGDTLLWYCDPIFEEKAGGELYEYTEKSKLFPACDSIIHRLKLTVTEADTVQQAANIYLSETLLWRCYQIPAAAEGTFHYYDTVPGTPCAEYYHLTLTVGCPALIEPATEEITICKGDTLLWYCDPIFEEKAGGELYEYTEKSKLFPTCDSVIHRLKLTVTEADTVQNNAEVYIGETLLWRCHQIYAAAEGTFHYYDTVPDVPCDKYYHLTMHVGCMEPTEYNDTIVYCGHDTLLWRCEQLTKSGDYEDVVKSKIAPQCDSIIYSLHLIYHKDTVAASWDTIYVNKKNLPYKWKSEDHYPGEFAYWEPFTLTDYEKTHGLTACDSLMHRVRLIQRDTVEGYTCNGDTLLWRCIAADHTAVYGDTVKATGVLSGEEIITELHYLDFTFNEAPKDSVLNLIVPDDHYDWRTGTLTENGTYRDTVFVIPGDRESCIDSLFTLNLKLEPAKDSVRYDTICAGDTLLWRCEQIYTTDEYHDNLLYPSGNDSIRFTLHLKVQEKTVKDWDTIYVHKDEFPYNWKGVNCPTPGEYELQEYYKPLAYQAEDEHGCDSLYSRVRLVLRDSTEMTSCNGEAVLWRCITADHTAVYGDTVKVIGAISGEETISELYYLDFTFFNAPKDSVLTDTISSDDLPYIWRQTTAEGVRMPIELTETGIYYDTTYYENNIDGCIDSLFTLNLRVEKVIDSVLYDTICRGEVELWRCFQADTTGWYRDTLRYEKSGNDSIRFAFRLEVLKDSIAPLEQVILCNGDSLLWYDQETEEMSVYLKTSGHYTCQTHYPKTQYQIAKEIETGKPVNGCDSVFHELLLIVRPMRDSLIKDTVCYDPESPVYKWKNWQGRDTTFAIPTKDVGNEWYTFTDTARYAGTTDCDSVRFTLKVYVRRIEGREFLTKDSVCAEGGVVPTSYEWVIENDNNRVVPVVLTPEERTNKGKFIVSRRDTVRYTKTSKGYECDSAYYELNLYVFRPRLNPNDPTKLDTLTQDTTVCYSDTYTWKESEGGNGETYSVADADEFTQLIVRDRTWKYTGTECDSVTNRLRLKFYDAPKDTAVMRMRVCQGEPDVTVGSITITTDESRTYLDSIFHPGTQCVKAYTLYDVTVLKPTQVDTTAVICAGEKFVWDRLPGKELSDSGHYTASILYPEKCDSLIFDLHLKVIELDSVTADTAYICYGQKYTWKINGKSLTLDSTGVYRDTVQSLGGCDSVYYTLVLEKQPAMLKQYDTLYICNGETSVVWPLNDSTITKEGLYYTTIRSRQGCDSIAGEVRVYKRTTKDSVEYATIYETETYLWRDGEEYSKEGTYYYEVYYKNSGCVDTLYTLHLKVEGIVEIVEDVRDRVCAGDSTTYGREITGHTEWSVTKRVKDERGALVDSVINFYIDVYDFDLPEGILDRVRVTCGMPILLSGASDIIDDYIDNNENYAPNAEQKWMISENGGEWKDLDTTVALDGKDTIVAIRCTVTSDCEPARVVERTYPVSMTSYMWKYTLYDFLPVISKYNGTMLMVDADAVEDKLGWKPKAEDVQWYKQDGNLDDWENPDPTDPRDIAMNKWGFYFTPEQATLKSCTYYALIKYDKPMESGNVCGMLARTLTIEGNSPITLNPTAATTTQMISIGGDGPYIVKVIDMFNETIYESPASGVNSFRAPSSSGTYIVQISDLGGRPLAYRTLIVY